MTFLHEISAAAKTKGFLNEIILLFNAVKEMDVFTRLLLSKQLKAAINQQIEMDGSID